MDTEWFLFHGIAYVTAVFCPHWFIASMMDSFWIGTHAHVGVPRRDVEPLRMKDLGVVMGGIERFLYVASLLTGQAAFIGVWIGLKVAGGWHAWKDGKVFKVDGEERKVDGRWLFNIHLIGNAANVVVAVVTVAALQVALLGEVAVAGVGLVLFYLVALPFADLRAREWRERVERKKLGNAGPDRPEAEGGA